MSDKGELASLPFDLQSYLLRNDKLLQAHFKTLIACKTNEHYQVSLEKLEAFTSEINRIGGEPSTLLGGATQSSSEYSNYPSTKILWMHSYADVFLVYVFVSCCLSADEEKHEKTWAIHMLFLMS